jgi:hypothetical protein
MGYIGCTRRRDNEINQQKAHYAASKSLLDSWKEVREEFQVIEPDSVYVMKALAIFSSAGVTPNEFMI